MTGCQESDSPLSDDSFLSDTKTVEYQFNFENLDFEQDYQLEEKSKMLHDISEAIDEELKSSEWLTMCLELFFIVHEISTDENDQSSEKKVKLLPCKNTSERG